MHDDIG